MSYLAKLVAALLAVGAVVHPGTENKKVSFVLFGWVVVEPPVPYPGNAILFHENKITNI